MIKEGKLYKTKCWSCGAGVAEALKPVRATWQGSIDYYCLCCVVCEKVLKVGPRMAQAFVEHAPNPCNEIIPGDVHVYHLDKLGISKKEKPCPDCAFTKHPGFYVGFDSNEACKTCKGTTVVSSSNH